jgi:Xaa-Pro aminopeptidase
VKEKETKELLKKKKLDYILIINTKIKDPNFFYFTNFDVESGHLLISKKESMLLVSDMEYERAKKEASIKKIKKFERSKLFLEFVKRKLKNKFVGINYNYISLATAKRLRKFCKIRDISSELNKIRAVKTEQEIEKIRKSCSAASEILEKCISGFKKQNFKKETDIKNFLEQETLKRGYELAFTIVASGKNSSLPHYNAEEIKLNKGFCVIDFGVKYKKYHSDITRTIYLGKPSKKEIKDYEKVLYVQQECIRRIKQGIKAERLYLFAKKKLKNMIHGLGHGLGVEIHESPNLLEGSKDKLEKNMVFTIEPGSYTNYGIRIEDTILLRDKVEILTKVDKKLRIIKV